MSLKQLETGARISLLSQNCVDAMNLSVGVLLVCLGIAPWSLGVPIIAERGLRTVGSSIWKLHTCLSVCAPDNAQSNGRRIFDWLVS
jgi:hypothetical protein